MDHVCPYVKIASKITLNLSEMFVINQPKSMKHFRLKLFKILFPDNTLKNFCINPKVSHPDIYQTIV